MANAGKPADGKGGEMHEEKFSFEDLQIWHEAVAFADKCLEVVERIEGGKKHYRLTPCLVNEGVGTMSYEPTARIG